MLNDANIDVNSSRSCALSEIHEEIACAVSPGSENAMEMSPLS